MSEGVFSKTVRHDCDVPDPLIESVETVTKTTPWWKFWDEPEHSAAATYVDEGIEWTCPVCKTVWTWERDWNSNRYHWSDFMTRTTKKVTASSPEALDKMGW